MAAIGNVRIKVKTEVLVEKAQSVSASIRNMSDCFDELERIINRTSYYWNGKAADAHRRQYQEQKAKVDEIMRRLQEHPRDLLAISQTYRTAEQEAEAIAGGLPGDVIE